jgi:putative endonuclease
MSGATSYHGGLAAEDQVARHYADAGLTLAARRWRGPSGEIDLILRDGAALVFVEVKNAGTLERAAERLTVRQMRRIWNAASEFLAGEPAGQDSEVRFDVALVDRVGRIDIVGNAISF